MLIPKHSINNMFFMFVVYLLFKQVCYVVSNVYVEQQLVLKQRVSRV